MHQSLHVSAISTPIDSYHSPVIPRAGEQIHVGSAAFRVTNVSYQICDQICESVHVIVEPINDAARQRAGKLVLSATGE